MNIQTDPQPVMPDEACEEAIARALMPGARLTAQLVQHSARQRIDDFMALATIVCAHPALAAHQAAWSHAVEVLDASGPERRESIGSSPLFRRWLHTTGRTLIEQGPGERLDECLIAVGNYTSGFAGECEPPTQLYARHGVIETWDCGQSVTFPAPVSTHGWFGVIKSGRVELRGEEGQLLLPLDTGGGVLPKSGIVVRNDLPGLRVALDESRAPERGEAVRPHLVDMRPEAYPQGEFPLIAAGADAIRIAWPEAYADWQQTLRVVVPRLAPAGWRMEGFSLSTMQGAIWVNPDDYLTVLESLVHENSHVKLRYVEEAMPLLLPKQDEARFPVGWRSDPRPIVGIFEGVYVHIHCAMALTRCLECGVLAASLCDRVATRIRQLQEQAKEGLALLQRHARLTLHGHGFLDWAQAALDDL
jgi:HEXXH motif-containing protein